MIENKNIKYLTGEDILVGDSVTLSGSSGKIVFVIPTKSYSNEYTEAEWGYLKEGFGIETEKYGLIHQVEPDEDLCFIKHES